MQIALRNTDSLPQMSPRKSDILLRRAKYCLVEQQSKNGVVAGVVFKDEKAGNRFLDPTHRREQRRLPWGGGHVPLLL